MNRWKDRNLEIVTTQSILSTSFPKKGFKMSWQTFGFYRAYCTRSWINTRSDFWFKKKKFITKSSTKWCQLKLTHINLKLLEKLGLLQRSIFFLQCLLTSVCCNSSICLTYWSLRALLMQQQIGHNISPTHLTALNWKDT